MDIPALDFHHGETIDMLRATVRQFAADEIAPRAAEIDRSNHFPADLWRKMGDLGLLGEDDLQFLWLPLAHSFGKVLEAAQLRIGFSTAVDGRVERIVEKVTSYTRRLALASEHPSRLAETTKRGGITASPSSHPMV